MPLSAIMRSVTVSQSWPPSLSPTPLAVLASGGLDSSVLLGEAVGRYPAVTPIFVRVGSIWEDAERAVLQRFCDALQAPNLRPIVELSQPVGDLYGSHWSLTGQGVPMLGEPDEASFLPGRNVLLLAKPLLWCLMNSIPELATAPLASNPFPDATDAFYDGMAELVGRSVSGTVRVLRPYAQMGLHKNDVIQRGRDFPLEFTLSCAKPVRGLNCGTCSKCGERMDGFAVAGIADPTHYAQKPKPKLKPKSGEF
ncbi:MAG: 7-cyano-7-deazaguanine synthase [Gemmataceae bacterium]